MTHDTRTLQACDWRNACDWSIWHIAMCALLIFHLNELSSSVAGFTATFRTYVLRRMYSEWLRHFINANMVWCHLFHHHRRRPYTFGDVVCRCKTQFSDLSHRCQLKFVQLARWQVNSTSFFECMRVLSDCESDYDSAVGQNAKSNGSCDDDVEAPVSWYRNVLMASNNSHQKTKCTYREIAPIVVCARARSHHSWWHRARKLNGKYSTDRVIVTRIQRMQEMYEFVLRDDGSSQMETVCQTNECVNAKNRRTNRNLYAK